MLIKLSTGVSLYGSLSREGEAKWKEKALARKRVSGKKVKRASGWWNLKKGRVSCQQTGSPESHKVVLSIPRREISAARL
jgi:hypothetical protein